MKQLITWLLRTRFLLVKRPAATTYGGGSGSYVTLTNSMMSNVVVMFNGNLSTQRVRPNALFTDAAPSHTTAMNTSPAILPMQAMTE